jgi:hypothetical protein
MTLAKRLLLGSAAALVATSGAQAADLGLPVAPAVDYVQICSIGSFTGWVLPGSDVCFDISGFARFQANYGSTASFAYLPGTTIGVQNVRGADDVDFVSEVSVNFDARTMTEWGLLRGYVSIGEDGEGEDYNADITKAFVQIGGFTAGLTDSFFDPVYTDYAGASVGGGFGPSDDLTLFGYTFAAGNGITLSASIEDNDGNNRYGGVIAVNGAGQIQQANGGGNVTAITASGNYQDESNGFAFVGAIRIDQAWGTAKLAGAVTEVDVDNTQILFGNLPATANQTDLGWAVQASAELNLPFGVNSTFGIHGIYTDGAISYAGLGGFGIPMTATTGIDLGADAIVNTVTGALETTEAYSLGAGLNIGFTNMVSGQLDAYYASVDHGPSIGAVGDYDVIPPRPVLEYE